MYSFKFLKTALEIVRLRYNKNISYCITIEKKNIEFLISSQINMLF